MRYSKHLFGLLFLVAIITLSCNEKTASAARKQNVNIIKAFTQKEVPGQQDAKTKNYLNLLLEFTGQEEIIVDSVLFDGKIYNIGAALHKFKIDLSRGIISKEQFTLKSNQAILFYSSEANSKKITIKNIETKQPIFLP